MEPKLLLRWEELVEIVKNSPLLEHLKNEALNKIVTESRFEHPVFKQTKHQNILFDPDLVQKYVKIN